MLYSAKGYNAHHDQRRVSLEDWFCVEDHFSTNRKEFFSKLGNQTPTKNVLTNQNDIYNEVSTLKFYFRSSSAFLLIILVVITICLISCMSLVAFCAYVIACNKQ